MEFSNSTALDDLQLHRMILRYTAPYRHDKLCVAVRYSRGADFSGTCYYQEARIFVNIGRHIRFPYTLGTNIAKARSNNTHWWRETYHLTVADGYQLALFVYLHELYHYLVKLAGRSPRRKESRCDRFAARALVDDFGSQVTDSRGKPVLRQLWDFQDLDRLVSKTRQTTVVATAAGKPRTRQIPVKVHGLVTSLPADGFLFEL